MKARISSLVIGNAVMALCVGFAGCAENTDTTEIGAQIEKENGGLDMDDEATLFGIADDFEDANLIDEEDEHEDELDGTTEITDVEEVSGVAVYHVAIRWGQMPGNRDNEVGRDWSGTLSVNRGAMVVRSRVAFEASDRVLPRVDRQKVSFESRTLPHSDGLRLTVLDPTPGADEPLVIAYRTGEGLVHSIAIEDLVAEPHDYVVDDANNRIRAIAMRRPVDVCDYGFLTGRWHKVGERFGVLRGRVTNEHGRTVGFMKGIYGVKRDGDRVFFAKVIEKEGRSRGIIAGHYGNNRFRGVWRTRDGEYGRAGGAYRETVPGPRIGGIYRGLWAETSCDIAVEPAMD